MAESGDGHCDSVGVAVVYALLIADRAAGMYDCCHTSFAGNLHAVGEGEEGVRGHDCTVEVKAERARFFDGLLEGVDT